MYRNICKQGLLLCVVLLVLTAPCAWPQASIATLSGTVRDQSAASIPSASVTLTKTDTGELFKSSTNSAGFYEFPGLVPGPYLLTVESRGMEKFEGSLIVHVSQRAVVDVTMKVGPATLAVVTVQSVTPMVETNNGSLAATLEQIRVQQLPINGRTLSTLLETVPGMEAGRALGAEYHSDSFTLDGADLVDREGWNDLTARQPGLDSIQEFNVITNGTSAQFARPTAIVASTKSGTNKLHGNAFETIRNNDLMYARTRSTYSAAPYLNRNEFGANAGGPVYIPKLYNGKDKTFFWVGYEALRQVNPTGGVGYPVPTQAWRQGNLAGDIDTNGIPYVIYDPYTTNPTTWARTAYNNNQITEPISPLAQFLLNNTPLPTLSNVNPNIADNWFGNIPAWTRNYTVTARVDHRFTDRDTFYARYTKGYASAQSAVAYGPPSLNYTANPSNTQTYHDPSWTLALNWVHTFSPTLFNQLTASGSMVDMYTATGNLNACYDQTELGLPDPFGCVGGWPDIDYAGFPNSPQQFDWEAVNANAYHQWYTNIDDNMTKIWGKHEFQFGVHYRADRENLLPQQQQVAGLDLYETVGTALYLPSSGTISPLPTPYTGDEFASFYLGTGLNYSNQLVRGKFYGREKEYAGYFQDNWKATSRLTLNLGVRWDYYPPFTEKNGIESNFDPYYNQGDTVSCAPSCPNNAPSGVTSQGALVMANALTNVERFGYTYPSIIARAEQLGMNVETTAQAGFPGGLQTSIKHDLAPRIGFAYKVTTGAKPFVLRGGYSLSYFHEDLDPWSAAMRSNAPMDVRFYYSGTQAAYSPDGISNYYLRTVPTIVAGKNSSNAVTINPSVIAPGYMQVMYLALNQPTPRVDTWNLTLQKELPWNMVLSASYVGNHSYNLNTTYNYNNPPPAYLWYSETGLPAATGIYASTAHNPWNQAFWGEIQDWAQTGWGNSNGAEIQLRRTFRGGSIFQFFYTLDNNLGAGGTGYNGTSLLEDPQQFAPGTVPNIVGPITSATTKVKTLEREYSYERDTSIPKQRYSWNWIESVPVGKGKRFLSNAGKLDKLVGGWQMAGVGTNYSTYDELPTGDFPTGTPVQRYGYKYPIKNCTSGTCYPGYLFYNGYISPQLINQPNGYEGIPANYQPAFQPLIPYGATTAPNAPASALANMSKFWNTNTAWVPLNNGTVQQTTWAGFSPLWQQWMAGPRQWTLDASLIKNIPFKEGRLNFRVEMDLFNVLNHPGSSNSIASTGFLSEQTSSNSPRTLQLVGRITF